MKVTRGLLPEVLIKEPLVFGDERVFFLESYNRSTFADASCVDPDFVQDYHTRSQDEDEGGVACH